MQERITELEIKLAHAEQALTELSDALYHQQQLIGRLERQLEALQHRVEAGNPGAEATDDKPPHY